MDGRLIMISSLKPKLIGILLCTFSIFFIILQTVFLFLIPEGWSLLGRPLSWWALAVPVYLIVVLFWLILLWIGWILIMEKKIPTSE